MLVIACAARIGVLYLCPGPAVLLPLRCRASPLLCSLVTVSAGRVLRPGAGAEGDHGSGAVYCPHFRFAILALL